MTESLKSGLGVRYLLPILTVYAAAASLVGLQEADLVQNLVQHGAAAGIAGLILLVFQDLAPPGLKATLVFWRVRNALPGHRAFSELAPRDPRIDAETLAAISPAGPETGAQQNARWYRWLKELEGESSVSDAHRRYLALRDCAALLLLLTLISPLLALVDVQTWGGALGLTGFCLVAYLVVMLSARHAAQRLVGNVIACKVATATTKLAET